jgi:hypothetical protein
MSKRFKHCILHIGTEKTGTSTLQNFLKFNRKKILKDGIFFPQHFNDGEGSQWEYVAASINNSWVQDIGKAFGIKDQEDHAIFLDTLTKDLERQFANNTKVETLLISSEHFHSRLSTQNMVQKLKEFLDPWVENFEVIVYFRRQDELARSHFSTRIKSGYQGNDPVLPQIGKLHSYYQYDELVKRWGKVFGKQALTVGLYPKIMDAEGTILYDFCRKCNIRLFGKKMPDHVNNSVNAAGLRFIQTMNAFLDERPKPRNAKLRSEIIGLVTELFSGPMYVLDKKTAMAFVQPFEEGNEIIRQQFFPEQEDLLFSNNYDHYPEKAESLTDEYVQAVQIAVTMWEQTFFTHRTRLTSKISKRLKRYFFKVRR